MDHWMLMAKVIYRFDSTIRHGEYRTAGDLRSLAMVNDLSFSLEIKSNDTVICYIAMENHHF